MPVLIRENEREPYRLGSYLHRERSAWKEIAEAIGGVLILAAFAWMLLEVL